MRRRQEGSEALVVCVGSDDHFLRGLPFICWSSPKEIIERRTQGLH